MTALASAFVEIRPQLDKTFAAKTAKIGKKAGEQLAEGYTRGADGRIRDAHGKFVKGAEGAGKKAGSGFSGHFKKAIVGLGGIVAGAFAVSKGIDFFKDSIAEAREAQKVGAQTRAVIKATGGAANVSAKQVSNLATALSNKSGIDDEVIQSGQNMLLTFKNVRNEAGKGNDIFNQSTKTLVDLSSAMGTQPKQAAIQLGKALNDPIKGITALTRVGVTFDDGQKKTIKHLVNTGHTMQAQKIILKELNSEFGGSAEAQATAGEKASVAWSNFKELLGTALLPIIDKVANFFTTKVIPALTTFITGMQNGTSAGGKFVKTLRDMWHAVSGVVDFLSKNKSVVATFVGVLAGFLIINKIVKAVAAFNIVLAANPIGIVVVALAGLAAGLVYAYKHSETFRKVVQKAWAIIKQAVKVAWENVIKPVLYAYAAYITNVLAPTLLWLWKHIVKPAFQAIGTIIGFMWRNVVRPLFRAWKAYLTDVLFPVIRFLWKNVIKPAFEGIGHVISFVWRNAIRPTFNNLKDGVSAVRSAFRTAVDAIGRIWNGLKQAAMAPVRFIVNTVYENGIRKVVNAIPGVHDLPKLHLNRGGPVFGGTPGRDSVDAKLTPGEHVWTASEVAKAGGHGAMYAMRKAVQHFAKGGAVWPTTGHRVSSYPGHDGADINGPGQDYGNPIFAWRSGKITYAGWGRGYGHAIFEKAKGFPTVVYGHGSAVYVHAGQSVRAGQTIGRVGSTGHSTGPHLHFGVPGGTYAQALALLHGAGSGGLLSQIGGKFTGLLGGGYSGPSLGSVLKHLTPGRWTGALRRIGGWGSMLSGMVGNLAGKVKSFATDKIHALIKAAGSAGKTAILGRAGAPGGSISSQLIGGARAYGWGNQISDLFNIVRSESGFNPRAENPTTTASGLFQMVDGTAHAYGLPGHASRFPVAQQIGAGLRYIRSRYGSPAGAWSFHKSHGWYDTGGILRHGGTASNRSGRPERVLNPRQTESFDRLVALLERGGLGGPGVHIDTVQTYDVNAAARAIRREQMKVAALMGSA